MANGYIIFSANYGMPQPKNLELRNTGNLLNGFFVSCFPEFQINRQNPMISRSKIYIAVFKRELVVYQRAMRDPRCPFMARFLLGAAVAYALSPIDLIPDFFPLVGHLDDVLVVPLLVWLGLRFLPAGLLNEVRKTVTEEHRRAAGTPAGGVPSLAVEQAAQQQSGDDKQPDRRVVEKEPV